jgi:hypothetical protein
LIDIACPVEVITEPDELLMAAPVEVEEDGATI